MNSSFANLFVALQLQIHAKVPTIVTIDQDLGQLKSTIRPAVSFPCVLIDFEDFKFENLSNNVQIATGIIVFKLCFEVKSNSSFSSPSGIIEQAIGFYDLEWQLHKALQNYNAGNSYGNLCRITALTQHRTDNYRVREIRYSISFDDYSTKNELTLKLVSLGISDVMV